MVLGKKHLYAIGTYGSPAPFTQFNFGADTLACVDMQLKYLILPRWCPEMFPL